MKEYAEAVVKVIKESFPDAQVKIDEPTDEVTGLWHVDFTINGQKHMLGIKAGKPLGFASAEALKTLGFGEGWPEVFSSVGELIERLRSL
jgi:hypothetical protein